MTLPAEVDEVLPHRHMVVLSWVVGSLLMHGANPNVSAWSDSISGDLTPLYVASEKDVQQKFLDVCRWSDGLHQSIEAKEGIEVSGESQVIATVTYQSLFRQFPKLCGMSGTATTVAPRAAAS